ncbi:hypothetical protein ACFLT9_01785 [Acidobacteriota bacterium]
MSERVIIMISIMVVLILVGLILIVAIRRKTKVGESTEPDYRTLFRIGAIWLPLGTISLILSFITDKHLFPAIPFFSMGLIFFLTGWTNRDKWKDTKKK